MINSAEVFSQQTLPVSGEFKKIVLRISNKVLLIQSDSCKIVVDGKPGEPVGIIASIDDSILYISRAKSADQGMTEGIKIYFKELAGIEMHGVADVESKGIIKTGSFKIVSSGAGNLDLELEAGDVVLELSGAGDIDMEGKANTMRTRISGVGELKAYEFETRTQDIKISGAGDAKIFVSEKLSAEVSGAGSIKYKGNPKEKQVEVSGVGSVEDMSSEISIGIFGDKADEGGGKYDTISATGPPDTTRFRLGRKRVLVIDDKRLRKKASGKNGSNGKVKPIWAGFEMGINGYLTPRSSFNLPASQNFLELDYTKSWNFNLNVWEQNFKLNENLVAITTGLGFEFNRYAFNNKIALIPDSTYVGAIQTNIKYRKNQLNASYLTVPLFLEFNTAHKHKKSFHVAVGGTLSYNLSSKSLQTYFLSGIKYKSKIREGYNIAAFKYGPAIRIGYGRLNMFAGYSLVALFKKNKGPEVYPFSAGITIIPFK